MIEKGCSRSFKKALIDIYISCKKDWQRLLQETEKPSLQIRCSEAEVIEDEKDILEGEIRLKIKIKGHYKVWRNGGTNTPEDEVLEEYLRSRRASMERTKLRVREIERGIDRFRRIDILG
jgi:hypothetical protein